MVNNIDQDPVPIGKKLYAGLMGNENILEKRESFKLFLESVVRDDASGQLIKLANFQHEIIKVLEDSSIRFLLILLPRNHTKTTLGAKAFPAWALGNNHNLRIIIATSVFTRSADLARGVEEIMKSTEYKQIFGNLIPSPKESKWTDEEKIIIRSRRTDHPSLLSLGTLSTRVPGPRADIVIADDLVTEESATSPILREKLDAWFWKALYPTLEPDTGRLIVLGTRYYKSDLYDSIITKFSRRKDAKVIIMSTPTSEGKPLWPERFSLKELDTIKQNMENPFYFDSQYRNSPIDMRATPLQYDWLTFTDIIPPDLKIYQGIDPCARVSRTSDYLAIATVGIDPITDTCYLLDMLRERAGPHDQIESIINYANLWKPEVITIETTVWQEFLRQSIEEKLPYAIRPSPSLKQKELRFSRMAQLFQSKKVVIKGYFAEDKWWPIESLRPFVDEWISFPASQHTDTLDSVDKATELLRDAIKPFSIDIDPTPIRSSRVQVLPSLRKRSMLIPRRSLQPLTRFVPTEENLVKTVGIIGTWNVPVERVKEPITKVLDSLSKDTPIYTTSTSYRRGVSYATWTIADSKGLSITRVTDAQELCNMVDMLYAFWDGNSKGTQQLINYAKILGKQVKVIQI